MYAVAWLSTFDKGRTFYCSLGHRQEIYWNPMILRHYLAGINTRWAIWKPTHAQRHEVIIETLGLGRRWGAMLSRIPS